MLEGVDTKIKIAMNTVFGASRFDEAMHSTMMKKVPDLTTAIDVAYRMTIDLARESNSPVEFVCGTFDCGECKECKTCDTVRKAEEWECRYRDWKESTYATDKNKR
nr:MAG TPA: TRYPAREDOXIN II, electron transport [Caudoviricetes sp.]